MIGYDTETINGKCIMITCYPDSKLGSHLIARSIIPFLKFIHSGGNGVFYNLDYDVSAIVKYISREKKRRLYKGIAVTVGEFELRYIYKKKLSIKRGKKIVAVYDCYQFFGCSLAVAAKKYLNMDKGTFNVVDQTLEQMTSHEGIQYAILDAELAHKLWQYWNDSLPEVLKKVQPLSPATYARAYFKKPMDDNAVPGWANRIYQKSFRGGRFECFQRGTIAPVYVYDINSAYPYITSGLTSLKNAVHRWTRTVDKSAAFGVALVSYEIGRDWSSPVMVRDDSGLCMSPVGRIAMQWITYPEVERLKQIGKVHKIYSCLNAYSPTTEKPFQDMIHELYPKKKEVYAYKILLNSLYGKLCQQTKRWKSVGMYPMRADNFFKSGGDMYAQSKMYDVSNFIYASYITAGTRLQLWDAMIKSPGSIIACFTDSVFSTEPLDLPVSNNIGDWDCEIFDYVVMLGSGVYFKRETSGGVSARFRGVGFTDAEEMLDRFITAKKSVVQIPAKMRQSFRQADSRKDYRNENLILEAIKNVDMNFDRKRIWESQISCGQDLLKTIKSWPLTFNSF